jgi:hypothetical protein
MLMIDEIVKRFAGVVIAGIRAGIGESGMFNTGKTSESLGFSWDGKELIIYSTFKYITVLEDGRRPGTWAPPGDIQEWVRTKLKITEPKENKSVAYLVNRSLKENGSLLWQKGGHSGILSNYLNEQYVQENLTNKLATSIVEFFIAELGTNRN